MRALDILIAASSSKMDWRSSQGAPDLDGAPCGSPDCRLPSSHPSIRLHLRRSSPSYVSLSSLCPYPAFLQYPMRLMFPTKFANSRSFIHHPSVHSFIRSLTHLFIYSLSSHAFRFESLTRSRSFARILRIKKMKEKINLILRN